MMKFDYGHGRGYDRYSAEFAFYAVFDEYNRYVSGEISRGASVDDVHPLLFSEATRIHDSAFSNRPYSSEMRSPEEIRSVVRDLMSNVPGASEWVDANFDSAWGRARGRFWHMTVGDSGPDGATPRTYTPTGVETGVLALSPFDERYRNREMFLPGVANPDAGGDGVSPRYVDVSSFDSDAQISGDIDSPRFDPTDRNLRECRVWTRYPNGGTDGYERYDAGTGVLSANDLFGVSDFYSHMSLEDYKDTVVSVNNSYNELLEVGYDFRDLGHMAGMPKRGGQVVKRTLEGGASNQEIAEERAQAMRSFVKNARAVARRGQAIMSALDDRGYQYDVIPSRFGGQVELRLRDSGVTVRVFDKPDSINMVGRTYDARSLTTGYARLSFSNAFGNQSNATGTAAERTKENNSRNTDASFARGFELPDDVFVNGVLYTLGEPVTLDASYTDEVMHRVREGSGRLRDTLMHMTSGDELADAVDLTELRRLAIAHGGEQMTADDVRSIVGSVSDRWPASSNVSPEFVDSLRGVYFRMMAAEEGYYASLPEGTPRTRRVRIPIAADGGMDDVVRVMDEAAPNMMAGRLPPALDNVENLYIEDHLSRISSKLDDELSSRALHGRSRQMGVYNGGQLFDPSDTGHKDPDFTTFHRLGRKPNGRVSMGYVSVRHEGRVVPDDVPGRIDWSFDNNFSAKDGPRSFAGRDADAISYVYGAVTSARENLAELVNIDELSALAREKVEEALTVTGEAPDPSELPRELSEASVSPLVDEVRAAYYSFMVDGYWAEAQAPVERPKYRMRETYPGVHDNSAHSILVASRGSFDAQASSVESSEWGGRVVAIDAPDDRFEDSPYNLRTDMVVRDHFAKLLDDAVGAVVDVDGRPVSYETGRGSVLRDDGAHTVRFNSSGSVIEFDGQSVEELVDGMDTMEEMAFRDMLPSGGSVATDSVWFDPVNVAELMSGGSHNRAELISACRSLEAGDGGHAGNVRRDWVRVGGPRVEDMTYDVDSEADHDRALRGLSRGEWTYKLNFDAADAEAADSEGAWRHMARSNELTSAFSDGIVTSMMNRKGQVVRHSPSTRFVDALVKFGDGANVVGTSDTSIDDVRVIGWAEAEAAASEFDASDADKGRFAVLNMVRDAVESNAARVSMTDDGVPDVEIDSHGVVRYKASFASANGTYGDEFVGEVGQFFLPDERGLYPTSFASSDNHAIVAGLTAYYLDGHRHDGTALERERVITLDEHMARAARLQIRRDLVVQSASPKGVVGQPVSLNGSYSKFLSKENEDIDYMERDSQLGLSTELQEARLKTRQGRVRVMEDGFADGTSLRGYGRYLKSLGDAEGFGYREAVDDRAKSALANIGFRSTSKVYPDELSVFDGKFPGGGWRQFDVRSLVSGASIEMDPSCGTYRLVPSKVEGDSCELMADDAFKYSEFDSFYRVQKTAGDVTSCHSVTEPVGVAAIALGGANQDDGCVVSFDFAVSHVVPDGNGGTRPLGVGDKMSDLHGNKWIIGRIVDASDEGRPEESDYVKDKYSDAEVSSGRPEIDRANFKRDRDTWKLFHDNPDLAIACPPDCAISRFNGGSFREAMDRGTKPLTCVDGKVVSGAIGMLRVAIQDKTVENKVTTDNGRKLGWQTSANIDDMGARKLTERTYGRNGVGFVRERESLRTAYGYDVADDATLVNHLVGHGESEKSVFGLARDMRCDANLTDTLSLSETNAKRSFSKWLGSRGGYVELPFPLKWPDYKTADGIVYDGSVIPQVEGERLWHMPVASSAERKGSENIDGEYVSHELTGRYENIFGFAVRYEYAFDTLAKELAKEAGIPRPSKRSMPGEFSDFRDKLRELDWVDDKDAVVQLVRDSAKKSGVKFDKVGNAFDKCHETSHKCIDSAQRGFDALCRDVAERNFTGKNNLSKRASVAARIPGSAITSVWASDPALSVDEIAIGSDIAAEFGAKTGDVLCVWRDPVLTRNCMRAMRAVVDDSIACVKVHPQAGIMLNGDFDGDQAGVYFPNDKEFGKQLLETMNVVQEMVDFRHLDKDGRPSVPILGGPDITRACAHDEGLAERKSALRDEAVDVFERHCMDSKGRLNLDGLRTPEFISDMTGVFNKVNVFIHEAQASEVGLSNGVLRFDNAANYMRSVYEVSVETGAKGSLGKLVDLGRYCGVHSPLSNAVELSEGEGLAEPIDFDSLEANEHTLHTYREDMSVMDATALKTEGTGDMGKFMQEFLMAFPDDVDTACTLAFGFYQKALDWKHNGEVAMDEYNFVPVVRDIFYKGVAYTYGEGDPPSMDSFSPVRDEKGRVTKGVPRDAWVETAGQALDAMGISLNKVYLERAADLMADDEGIVYGSKARAAEVCSPLVKAAFDGKADTLIEAAQNGKTSLYRATVELHGAAAQSCYEPRCVREAVAARTDGEASYEPYVARTPGVEAVEAEPQARERQAPVASVEAKDVTLESAKPASPEPVVAGPAVTEEPRTEATSEAAPGTKVAETAAPCEAETHVPSFAEQLRASVAAIEPVRAGQLEDEPASDDAARVDSRENNVRESIMLASSYAVREARSSGIDISEVVGGGLGSADGKGGSDYGIK